MTYSYTGKVYQVKQLGFKVLPIDSKEGCNDKVLPQGYCVELKAKAHRCLCCKSVIMVDDKCSSLPMLFDGCYCHHYAVCLDSVN